MVAKKAHWTNQITTWRVKLKTYIWSENKSKNGKHFSSAKAKEDNSKIQKLSINSNFSENIKLFKPSNGNANNHSQIFEQQIKDDRTTPKEGSQSINGLKANVVPVKPIPQRVNGSKINILLNAWKINNYMKTPTVAVAEENTKKREEKAQSKINELINNSDEVFLSNNSHSLAKNMQETIATLLSMKNGDYHRSNSDELLLSSSEEREQVQNQSSVSNLRPSHKNEKKRGENCDGFTNDKQTRFLSHSAKKSKHSNSKSLKKAEYNYEWGDDGVIVSNIIKSVQVGNVKKLILGGGSSTEQEVSIDFNLPPKKLVDSNPGSCSTPNLDLLLSKGTWSKEEAKNDLGDERSNTSGSICLKIANIIKETFIDRTDDRNDMKRERQNSDLKINSIPILNAFDLRLF